MTVHITEPFLQPRKLEISVLSEAVTEPFVLKVQYLQLWLLTVTSTVHTTLLRLKSFSAGRLFHLAQFSHNIKLSPWTTVLPETSGTPEVLFVLLCGSPLVAYASCEAEGTCVVMVHYLCEWIWEKVKGVLWVYILGQWQRDKYEGEGAWQLFLLCSLVLFVVGVITCSSGQRVSPLCLIWKTATVPPTAGTGHLSSDTVLGIGADKRHRPEKKTCLL